MDAFERWITLAGPHRLALLEPLRPHLSRPVEPPDDVAAMMAPVRDVLALGPIAGLYDEGVASLATEFASRYGFHDPASGQEFVDEARVLVIHLATSGLLVETQEGFAPSARLAAAARNPRALWALLADSLLTGHYVFASQPELAVAAMARRTLGGDNLDVYKQALLEAILIEERPTTASELASIAATAAPFTATICRALRMLRPDSPGVATATFTPGGLALALRALRAAAHSDARFGWALEEAGVAARN